jgi:hypothetical protein
VISVATIIDVCCFCAMASVFSLVLLLVASSGAGLSCLGFFVVGVRVNWTLAPDLVCGTEISFFSAVGLAAACLGFACRQAFAFHRVLLQD